MDFLGIGIPEFIVIFLLAFIFLKPTDIPKLATRLGSLVRQTQMMVAGIKGDLKQELTVNGHADLLELKKELYSARKALAEVRDDVNAVGQEAYQAAKTAKHDVDLSIKEIPVEGQ